MTTVAPTDQTNNPQSEPTRLEKMIEQAQVEARAEEAVRAEAERAKRFPADISAENRHALEWAEYLRHALHRLSLDETKTPEKQRTELEAGMRPALPLHWALAFGATYDVFPIWPVVEGKCTCHAGAACRSAGRHPRIKGLREAVRPGFGPSVDRAALDQITTWWRDAPTAWVGIALTDNTVSVYGVETFSGWDPEQPLSFFQTLTFTNHQTEETEMLCNIETGKVLSDDLGSGVFVRQPGDFVLAYGDMQTETGARTPVVDVDHFGQYPAPAPKWLADLSEGAPKAICEADIRLASVPAPVHWLCRDLGVAPGRPTVIAGRPGEGKSPFAAAFAICVATGQPFLGMPVRQERVAWAAFEAAPVTHLNLQRFARAVGVDPGTVAIDAWPFRGKLNDRGTMAELRRRIRAEGHGLLVIDSYTSALRDVDHNSSAFGDALRQLEKLSDETGCTVVVLMHVGKKSEVAGSREIAGHFSAVASAQAVISLTRPEADRLTRFKVSCSRALFAPFDPLEVEFRDVHQSFKIEKPAWGLRLVRAGDNGIVDFIVGMVDAMPGTSRQQIVDCARGQDYGRNETDAALAALEESGQLLVEKAPGKAHQYRVASRDIKAAS